MPDNDHSASILMIWSINILVIVICMVKLLVYGDPWLGSETKASEIYWKHRKEAEQYFSMVNNSFV